MTEGASSMITDKIQGIQWALRELKDAA